MTADQLRRFLLLSSRRNELLDAMAEAEAEWDDARMTLFNARGTRGEGNAQGRLARAENAFQAAEGDLDDWLKGPDGAEWNDLDQLAQVPRTAD